MATVQNRASYWEQAKEQGFDLSWLSKLQENVARDDVDEISVNNTGRVEGSIPRNNVAQFGAYTFRTKSEVWAHNLTKALSRVRHAPVEFRHRYPVGDSRSSARRYRSRRVPVGHLLHSGGIRRIRCPGQVHFHHVPRLS